MILPTRRLLLDSLRVFVWPPGGFERWPEGVRPSYRTLVGLLVCGGLFFIVWHARFVLGLWVWHLAYWPLILAQYALLSIWAWLLGTWALMQLFRWGPAARPRIEQVEIAVVALWLTWAVMPLADILHLRLPTLPLIAHPPWHHFFVVHASIALTFPLRAALLYVVLRRLGRWTRTRAAVSAVVIALGARFLAEPSGGLFLLAFHRLGWEPNFWVAQHVVVGGLLVLLVAWRLAHAGLSGPRLAGCVAAGSLVLVVATAVLLGASTASALPFGRPAPARLPDRAVAEDPTTIGPFLDGADHEQWLIRPVEAPPQLGAVLAGCAVELSARDGQPRNDTPWGQCDLVPAISPSRSLSGSRAPLDGRQTIESRWRLTAEEQAAVQAGQASLRVRLGVHGGGDYTGADVVTVHRFTPVWEQRDAS